MKWHHCSAIVSNHEAKPLTPSRLIFSDNKTLPQSPLSSKAESYGCTWITWSRLLQPLLSVLVALEQPLDQSIDQIRLQWLATLSRHTRLNSQKSLCNIKLEKTEKGNTLYVCKDGNSLTYVYIFVCVNEQCDKLTQLTLCIVHRFSTCAW